jgi:hypothetical protein
MGYERPEKNKDGGARDAEIFKLKGSLQKA